MIDKINAESFTLSTPSFFFVCTIMYSYCLLGLFRWEVNDSFKSIVNPKNFVCVTIPASLRSFMDMVSLCTCLLRSRTGRTFVLVKFSCASLPFRTKPSCIQRCHEYMGGPEYTTASSIGGHLGLLGTLFGWRGPERVYECQPEYGATQVPCGTSTWLYM